jgi:hypothetical protein
VHGCIVCISFARQVGIYHSPYGCEAVWKPPELCSDLSSTDMFSKLYAFVLNSLRIDNRSRSSLSANALCAADYALQDLHKFTDVSTTADHNWKVAYPLALQVFHQSLALCCFSAPINSFKKNKSTSTRSMSRTIAVLSHPDNSGGYTTAVVSPE